VRVHSGADAVFRALEAGVSRAVDGVGRAEAGVSRAVDGFDRAKDSVGGAVNARRARERGSHDHALRFWSWHVCHHRILFSDSDPAIVSDRFASRGGSVSLRVRA